MPSPLITAQYTADPSAHVFGDRVYIYPSHDRETDIAFNDNGDQYDMADYHVYSLPLSAFSPDATSPPSAADVTDHGVVLRMEDVPWVSKQLWAPDCARGPHDGKYYLYFPARDLEGRFRIGVAVSDAPHGPFKPDPQPIQGSLSIDPAAFVDDDGEAYLYFGGLWGGQLQCYQDGDRATFDKAWLGPQEPKGEDKRALFPKVARLAPGDMGRFASASASARVGAGAGAGAKEEGGIDEEEEAWPRNLEILAPETGLPIPADDHDRRFFEAAWMHKRDGTYYFSYSTGDTHYIAYATSSSPLGPFTYAGRILEPVLGWTTHHSIVETAGGRWWLFYHDCELSGGVDHLRSVKVREIFYDDQGKIVLEKV
ncbi:glycosyl hydrolase [Xylariales sp. PMI_506]|nr:glycosyl hydrolase [Xylariales sp. PMI_506]